jgi:hypothetical protein
MIHVSQHGFTEVEFLVVIGVRRGAPAGYTVISAPIRQAIQHNKTTVHRYPGWAELR